MKTIDSLLHFVFLEAMTSVTPFSSRDNKTLQSLHAAMQSDTYITEKQSNLLLTILSNDTYSSFMSLANATYKEYLADPQWSKPFRILPDVKKIYHIPAGSDKLPRHNEFANSDTGVIAIEFTFSSIIRNHLKSISTVVLQIKSGSLYMADYTEQNLVLIIDTLLSYNFEIEPKLLNCYDLIKSWNKDNTLNTFKFESSDQVNFCNLLTTELGNPSYLTPAIIHDRRLKYQYMTSFDNIITNHELTNQIINRDQSKIWINSNTYSINDIIRSLVELRRFPLLVVFDQSTDFSIITQFNELSHALTVNGITDEIGFYFRLDNTPDGKIFNDTIGKRQYNSMLTEKTKVAAVLGGKLPKFFLKEKWKPMSVLSIKNTLRHSKTAVYAASYCDLLISYTSVEPIIETRTKWELD